MFLNNNGFAVATTGPGSPGNESSYFGAKTKVALTKFQNAYAAQILTPQGLTKGTGILGPYTRQIVNEFIAGSRL
jgi:hypothetical protein